MLVGVGVQPSLERHWQKYPRNQTQCWREHPHNKHQSNSSEFSNRSKKEAQWLGSCNRQQGVSKALHTKPSCEDAGARSFGSGTSFSGHRKANIAVCLRLPTMDGVSWAELISQHTKSGHGRQALKTYEEMLQVGAKPTTYTFVAVLKACCSLRDLERARKVHAEVVTCGFETDVYVGTVLVDVYAKCGSLVDARRVFERMPHRNVVSWTAMILGYAQLEEGELALQLFRRMQLEGVVPNSRTFVGALKAYSSLAAWEEGKLVESSHMKQQFLEQLRAIHLDVVKRGFELDVYVGTMLVDVYAKFGSLEDARHVFEKMPYRNVVSWTAMIFGYAQMEEGEEALQLYACMQKDGVAPNDHTFVGALKACGVLASSENKDIHHSKPVRTHCLEQVRAIHSEVLKRGCESGLFVGNMLLDAYAKCGSLVDARQVFEKMPQRNVVTWTAMILGYAQIDEADEALQLYARMQQEGVVPNDRTHIGALKACGTVAGLEKGKEIHALVSSSVLEVPDSFVASSLIDMYGKCGSMIDAQQVFDASPSRDIVMWSALITGYARQGESDFVFRLFERMRQEGIQPNGITFLSVLTACSHAGLVDKGRNYFAAMSRDFGITPSIEHYTCMIDVLGRAGQVDDAMVMAKTMPFEPDVAVWETVLGACQKWSYVDLGREAFDCAVSLDRNGSAKYVSMSNIYASAQMWDDAKHVQDMRVKVQAWKQPGQSLWTSMDGTVHAFMVLDTNHRESKRLRSNLRDLYVRVEEEGYVTYANSLSPDFEEHRLSGYTRTLTIAFARLKGQPSYFRGLYVVSTATFAWWPRLWKIRSLSSQPLS